MNVNYISFFLMLVCSLLAFKIYLIRKENADVAELLLKTEGDAVVLNEKKIVCENDVKSQEGALKELSEALEMRKKENEEVQKNLNICTQDLAAKKAEKEAEAKSEVNNTETESDPQVRAAVKYL